VSCWFTINQESVTRACKLKPYERAPTDPVSRPLWIYALDPSLSQLEGGVAQVTVPFEPLKVGPAGTVVQIVDQPGLEDPSATNLDSPIALMGGGYLPSMSKDFKCQMLYAVTSTVYQTFRQALGRYPPWATAKPLTIVPFKPNLRNAFYDPETHSLCFGTFEIENSFGPGVGPGGEVFTCLSHDIIAHEISHALLDGLRPNLRWETNPDVPAFHEAFSDMVAVFHHFTYREVLEKQTATYRGDFAAGALVEIAKQFGYTYKEGSSGPLRTAVDPDRKLLYDDNTLGTYERGTVLLAALFDAFLTVYNRKTERDIRLATGGSGILPPGNLNGDLVHALAEKASSLAAQFLRIAIRALDYCPPVDLEFGEFLRALVTADYDLVPVDRFGYREALIRAFARRRIPTRGLRSLIEEEVRWRPPKKDIVIEGLKFANLRHPDQPGAPADEKEVLRRAAILGEAVSRPDTLGVFGFAKPGDVRCARVYPPSVESIHAARRTNLNNETLFDLVAEVVQRIEFPSGNYYGGATIIIDPKGHVRYTISKSSLNEGRFNRQQSYRPPLKLEGKRTCSRVR